MKQAWNAGNPELEYIQISEDFSENLHESGRVSMCLHHQDLQVVNKLHLQTTF